MSEQREPCCVEGKRLQACLEAALKDIGDAEEQMVELWAARDNAELELMEHCDHHHPTDLDLHREAEAAGQLSLVEERA